MTLQEAVSEFLNCKEVEGEGLSSVKCSNCPIGYKYYKPGLTTCFYLAQAKENLERNERG